MTIEQILRRAGSQAGRNLPPQLPPPPRQLRFPSPRRGGLLAWARMHPWLTGLMFYFFWLTAWGFHLWNVYVQRQLDAAMGF